MCKKMLCLLSFIFLLTMVPADMSLGYSPGLDPSLVAWWRLDETAGITAFDSSDNGHDGTLTNGPMWVAGYFGGAVQFDGVDDYVDTGWTEDLATWTIACWVKSPAAPSTSEQPSGPLHRENNYQFNWNHISGGTWPGSVAASINYTWINASLGPLEADTWYHICGTYDGTALKAYTYGVLITTIPFSGNPAPESNTMKLGRHALNADYFGGIVDDARVYNRALTLQEIQAVMGAGIDPAIASNPGPVNEATDVLRDSTLSWEAGQYADTHDVYFGTSLAEVDGASRSNPDTILASEGQSGTTFDPGRLEFAQTYYWRVDEINAPPDDTVFKGEIWSFTVEPFTYPIPAANIIPAAFSQSTGQGPEKTVDGSGLNADDQHSTVGADMWLSAAGDPGSAWIEYQFDKSYKLHEMLIWNYNGYSILSYYGIKEVTIEYSAGNVTMMQADISELAQASGAAGYAANTIVPFDGKEVKYVKITADNNWMGGAGIFNQYGLSEVRFMTIPVSARTPCPDDGATDVDVDVTLSWRPGREAAEHNVYLDTDQQAVTDRTAVVTVPQAGYGPLSLDLDTTYYWSVDEVNNSEVTPVWQGDTWSFSTQEYLVVDDFESYNDIATGEEGSNIVYEMWIDGYTNPSVNGSTIGYVELFQPSMESSIVHSGNQSVPVTYNNTNASKSEVTVSPADLAIGSNWNLGSPSTLVLWFYGDPNNTATEQMYVKINNAKVVISDVDLTLTAWQNAEISLADFGINLANVTQLVIGLERTGATGSEGILFMDDIRLYKLVP